MIKILLFICILFPTGRVFSQEFIKREFKHPKTERNIWIYLPKDYKGKKFPCVLIAPAGSRLYHGMDLTKGDEAEHIPYVKAGFAVIAYEVAGKITDENSEEVLRQSLADYLEAKAGILDAANALSFAQNKTESIDSQQVYVAGHSSAAATALSIAQSTSSIKGVVAYAPPANLVHELRHLTRSYESHVPGYTKLIESISPIDNVSEINCPVFLFHALDDDSVKPLDVSKYANQLRKAGKAVTRVECRDGGHYDSMISEGIPAGIEWLKSRVEKKPIETDILLQDTYQDESLLLTAPKGFRLTRKSGDDQSIEKRLWIEWFDPNNEFVSLSLFKWKMKGRDKLNDFASQGRMSYSKQYREKYPDAEELSSLEKIPLKNSIFKGMMTKGSRKDPDSNKPIQIMYFFLSLEDEIWTARFEVFEGSETQVISILESATHPEEKE